MVKEIDIRLSFPVMVGSAVNWAALVAEIVGVVPFGASTPTKFKAFVIRLFDILPVPETVPLKVTVLDAVIVDAVMFDVTRLFETVPARKLYVLPFKVFEGEPADSNY